MPKEQMRSSYLRRREGGEVALPMPWAMRGYSGKAGRNSPAVSEAPRQSVFPQLHRHSGMEVTVSLFAC